MPSQPAVHRTIAVVDVEGFGDDRRTHPFQVAVREGLYDVLERAFDDAGVPWAQCYKEDRGDGVFVLGPTDVPKSIYVESLPLALVKELRRHNAMHPEQAQIRLRLALHAGEVTYDAHGIAGKALNLAFRLSDAPALKAALTGSPGLLALITSTWFFEEVVRNSPASEPASYQQVRIAVKETSTAGWICTPDYLYPAKRNADHTLERATLTPRQLPAYTPHFVGREQELSQLDSFFDTPNQTALIVTINGVPGIGKTALAVHWAQRVQGEFADGQLYVDLRGFDPTTAPVTPIDAIRGFLDAFNVPPERIPPTLDGHAALYRSVVAGRRLLVVLDNALDVEQVRPLLPGSPTCVVMVTSRNQLVDLITWEGARPVNLGEFALPDATALLTRRIGQHRLNAEPEAVVHLLDRCARLPLAVAMVAARLELNPHLTIRMLADELADESARLDALDRLRTVLAASYQQLDPVAARIFRLIGLHPGSEMPINAIASLAGAPVTDARAAMVTLVHAHLVMEVSPGRFTFHTLLRSYAVDQTQGRDTDAVRQAAIHRLLDYYLHTCFAAEACTLAAHRGVSVDGPPQVGVAVDAMRTQQQAKDWFAAEHRTLLLMIKYACELGFDVHAWKLAWALSSMLEWQGHWRDLVSIEGSVLSAVERIDDAFARGRVHAMLGWMYGRIGQANDAHDHGRQALTLTCKVGDGMGEAGCHFVLALAYGLEKRQEQAFHHLRQTLDYFEYANDRRWQAAIHRLYAWIYSRADEHEEALKHCEQGLQLLREAGGSHYEFATLENLLGWTMHRLGRHQDAIDHYANAIAMYRELTDFYNEADVLRRLGDARLAASDVIGARAIWQKAIDLVDELNVPNVDEIRARLEKRLTPARPLA